jgi:hypothetical protein
MNVPAVLPGTGDARKLTGRRWARAGLILLLALNAAALAVRVAFVLRSGAYAETTGFEGFSLYNIWKVRHGYPLYEWPQRGHYLLTSYNFGFYHLYAAWTRLWGADGEALVPCARWLTLAFAFLGMLMQVRLLRRLVPRELQDGLWLWGLAFLTWFGTAFNGWNVLSARPDVAGVVFALTGLVVALRAQETGRRSSWLLSSLLFFAAWSCKQSIVWIFAGTVLCSLRTMRWRAWLPLAGPFAILSATVIWRGGEIYRYNIFAVPGVYRWMALNVPFLLAECIGLSAFFWFFGFGVLADGLRCRTQSAVVWATCLSLIFGAAALAMHGSSLNNLLEGYVMIATLATAGWLRSWRGLGGSRVVPMGAALLFSMAPLPAFQLGMAARGVPYAEIGKNISVGNLIKLNDAQLAQRRRFAAWERTLPKPLWTTDGMLQLPWFANDNAYPAFPTDFQFEEDAVAGGLIPRPGIEELIQRKYFASLLIMPGSVPRRFALHYGYRVGGLPPGFRPFANPFGLDQIQPMFLMRP